MINILKNLKIAFSEIIVKLLTIEAAVLSILTFFIMEHGFIFSQFVLKSCHLLVYQSNDQGGWMSPCENHKGKWILWHRTPKH